MMSEMDVVIVIVYAVILCDCYIPGLCMWIQMVCTALGKATRVGHTDTIILLLMRNALPDLKDKVRFFRVHDIHACI